MEQTVFIILTRITVKTNKISLLGFCTSFVLLLLCCSCSVGNKVLPFDSFSKNTPTQGNKMPIFEDAFGKDVSYIINLLGSPDYQTGAMEYIDYTGISPYWHLLGSSYEQSTIPIKAYAWKQDNGYVLCCCSYNDFRFTQMPQCLIYNNGVFILQDWLSQHSGDEGFSIMSIRNVNDLNDASIACTNKVVWLNYNHTTTMSLRDFYCKSFSFKPAGISKSLIEMIGEDRKHMHALLGHPCTSLSYRKCNVPSDIIYDCWIGYDTFPNKFYIDEYRYEDKSANSTGTMRCYYKKTGANMTLIFASLSPDVKFYVEY